MFVMHYPEDSRKRSVAKWTARLTPILLGLAFIAGYGFGAQVPWYCLVIIAVGLYALAILVFFFASLVNTPNRRTYFLASGDAVLTVVRRASYWEGTRHFAFKEAQGRVLRKAINPIVVELGPEVRLVASHEKVAARYREDFTGLIEDKRRGTTRRAGRIDMYIPARPKP
jgi:hypothetical protein